MTRPSDAIEIHDTGLLEELNTRIQGKRDELASASIITDAGTRNSGEAEQWCADGCSARDR